MRVALPNSRSPNLIGAVLKDLGKTISANPRSWRIHRICLVTPSYLELHLSLLVAGQGRVGDLVPPPASGILRVKCTNAMDYSIRPTNPATIMGGPLIEFHEQHSLLNDPRLQCIPGGDGEVFNPPFKFSLLIIDQSHVIAEKFEYEEVPRG